MAQVLKANMRVVVALHRSAWIEIKIATMSIAANGVALHRSAWIEIACLSSLTACFAGRTPQECVDRNFVWPVNCIFFSSRTPQECVDRNLSTSAIYPIAAGRTPQECVDRNFRLNPEPFCQAIVALHRSAWIEMLSL